MPKMTNGQKWQRIKLLRGLRTTLGQNEIAELLRLELELSISQARGHFKLPEKPTTFVIETVVDGVRTRVAELPTTAEEIKQAMPYATIEGNVVTVFASPPLGEEA